MRKIAIVAMLGITLAGCETTPPRPEQLRVPPSNRLLGLQNASEGSAQIVVTRDVGASGSGCYTAVFMDGKEVAKLGTGERATFHVTPGDHILGAWTTGSGICGFREGKDRKEVSVHVDESQAKRFRITNPGAGDVELNPTTLL